MSIIEAIKILDKLYSERKFNELCDLFKTKFKSDDYKSPDLMWRHARGLRELGLSFINQNVIFLCTYLVSIFYLLKQIIPPIQNNEMHYYMRD